jgi:hypothetical protein
MTKATMTSKQVRVDDEGTSGSARDASAITRRTLLHAAGGFTLAASGLFLPQCLEEAAARPGANGKDHKRRDKKHDRGKKRDKRDDNDKRKAPGCPWPKGIRFEFAAGGISKTVKVDFYKLTYDSDLGIVQYAQLLQSRTVAPYSTVAFQSAHSDCMVRIDDNDFIEARNPLAGWPEVTLGYGGEITGSGVWNPSTIVVPAREIDEYESARMTQGDWDVSCERLSDLCDYKVFSVKI